MNSRAKKGYPRGVISLSMIECFERFGFYATQGILVLYAVASATSGGLGWSNAQALQLVGIFSAVVYGTPILGGWIADKYMGRKAGMALGNILLFLGYLVMTQRSSFCLYSSIVILAIGTGFLKPTISAMVGEFYNEHDDSARDAGFAIFYMSINIGGTIGPFISGYIAQYYGYSYAFGSSCVGMALALINTFISMRTTLKPVGNLEKKKDKHTEKVKWTKEEKIRVWVYILICVSNIMWNIFYTLPYGLLNLWADTNIDRHFGSFTVPTAWYYGSYSIAIIIFSPVTAKIYQKLDSKGINFSLSYKLGVAYLLMGIGCLVLMPLVVNIAHNTHYIGSSAYFEIFYVIFSFSELLTIPILLSAATKFAPEGFSATLVSLNMLISWCIGAYLGGLVSSLTETISPIKIFVAMIVACLVFFIGHIITNRFVEKHCNNQKGDVPDLIHHVIE